MKSDFETIKETLEKIGASQHFDTEVPMGWIEDVKPVPRFINFGVDALVFTQSGRLIGTFCSESCHYEGDPIKGDPITI